MNDTGKEKLWEEYSKQDDYACHYLHQGNLFENYKTPPYWAALSPVRQAAAASLSSHCPTLLPHSTQPRPQLQGA